MSESVQTGIRRGVTFGVIFIFISLIGFGVTAAELIEELLGDPSGNQLNPDVIGYAVFIAVISILAGFAAAAQREEEDGYDKAVTAGIVTGLISSLMLTGLTVLMGILRINEIDPRNYLVQFSPLAIRLYLYDLSLIAGAAVNVALITVSAAAGGALRRALRSDELQAGVSARRKALRDRVNNHKAMTYLRENATVRYTVYGVVVLALLLMPQFINQYWNFVLGTIGIYVIMGLGLNLEIGFAGLLDIGYVAFFAVGAYTVGLLTSPEIHNLTWNFWFAFPIGVILAGLAGVLLGIPVLRLRGDYLAIVTLGLGEIIRILIKSDVLTDFSGGPQGIRNIAQPELFGINLGGERAFLYMILVGIGLAIILTIRLRDSRVGRAWMALREDETVARAMGINHVQYKLLAFGLGAALAGFAGVLFASRNQFTGPEDHVLIVSINVLSEVIVGGMGSIPGVITGAFALKGLPEILRQVENYRVLAFGVLLIVMMILRPQGLWPSQRRRRVLDVQDQLEQLGIEDDAATVEEGPAR